MLGTVARSRLIEKPLKFREIDKDSFSSNVTQVMSCIRDDDLNCLASSLSDALYACVESSVTEDDQRVRVDRMELGRWERLLEDGDDSRVWRAINWKGDFNVSAHSDGALPSDGEFRDHFEEVLNPPGTTDCDVPNVATDVSIPVLDEPISPSEMQSQIRRMKPDKACRPDGIPSGMFSLLPAEWIVTLATLFNKKITSEVFPHAWIRARVFVIFKRGDRTNPYNYRGISVINAITKLYDVVLCEGLNQWFKPDREQAKAQRKRGYLEHIVTLRLITNMARQKIIKLFVFFVDFSKAYDTISRHKLLMVMKWLGCGAMMLAVVVTMYRTTESAIGSAIVTASQGVRQGSPTFFLLFILFVNVLIRDIKEECQPERFIEWLHVQFSFVVNE